MTAKQKNQVKQWNIEIGKEADAAEKAYNELRERIKENLGSVSCNVLGVITDARTANLLQYAMPIILRYERAMAARDTLFGYLSAVTN